MRDSHPFLGPPDPPEADKLLRPGTTHSIADCRPRIAECQGRVPISDCRLRMSDCTSRKTKDPFVQCVQFVENTLRTLGALRCLPAGRSRNPGAPGSVEVTLRTLRTLRLIRPYLISDLGSVFVLRTSPRQVADCGIWESGNPEIPISSAPNYSPCITTVQVVGLRGPMVEKALVRAPQSRWIGTRTRRKELPAAGQSGMRRLPEARAS